MRANLDCMVRVEARGADAFEAAVSASFVPLRLMRSDAGALRGTVEQKRAGAAAVSLVQSGPVTLGRTLRLIDRSERVFVLLMMQLHGTSTVAQGGRIARLRPGQGAIYYSDRPYELTTAVRSDVIVFHAPLADIGLPSSRSGGAGVRLLDAATSPDYRAVRNLSRSYLRPSPAIEDEREMGRITSGLVASILARLTGGFRSPLDHGTLFVALCDEIDARLKDPSLSVASLARSQGVSLRTVYECFERHGTSPARLFRERRLSLATSLLRNTNLPIARVAATVGMLDASTLAKTMRRELGTTPREVRHQHQR